MARNLSILCVLVIAAFVLSTAPSCKMPGSADQLKNIKLGKFAETVNIAKDELDKPIKTQWGKINLNADQVKKIKKLKEKKYVDLELKTDKGKTLTAVVTYMGANRYQFAFGGV